MHVIEKPVSGDEDALATLFHEDMTDLGVDVRLDDLRRLAGDIVRGTSAGDPEFLCWVARLEEDGEAVGVILANLNYSLKFAGRALWIEELYVTPRARRNGLGRLLVESLLDWAEENEICGVDLEAYQGNTPASILYRSLGFHRLGRERFYYRIGSEEYL
jgi:ribosomal protein S18 acetylase RimI-like enzyme